MQLAAEWKKILQNAPSTLKTMARQISWMASLLSMSYSFQNYFQLKIIMGRTMLEGPPIKGISASPGKNRNLACVWPVLHIDLKLKIMAFTVMQWSFRLTSEAVHLHVLMLQSVL